MKKAAAIILTVVICFITLQVQAQPVLNNNYNPSPQPGTIINITRVNAGAITQGASGAAITWNFASLSTLNSKVGTFVVPNATPFGASFPNSTIAVAYNPAIEYGSFNANYEFFNISNAAFIKNGFANNASTPVVVNYTDPKVVMPYPFTFGNAHFDDFLATYTSGANSVTESGSFTATADAYGTLTLPYGTIHNVLRVHFVETYTQTIPGFDPFTYNVETYAWYHPKLAYPFFSISSEEVNGSPQPSIIARYIEIPGFDDSIDIVGINIPSGSASVSVYPNPMQKQAVVSIGLVQSAKVQASIYNLSGQRVAIITDDYLLQGTHTLPINAESLPKGMYLLELSIDGNVQTSKLIVQ